MNTDEHISELIGSSIHKVPAKWQLVSIGYYSGWRNDGRSPGTAIRSLHYLKRQCCSVYLYISSAYVMWRKTATVSMEICHLFVTHCRVESQVSGSQLPQLIFDKALIWNWMLSSSGNEGHQMLGDTSAVPLHWSSVATDGTLTDEWTFFMCFEEKRFCYGNNRMIMMIGVNVNKKINERCKNKIW